LKSGSEEVIFASKRNKVILRDGIVEKHYSSPEAAGYEADSLKLLRVAGLNVPKLIGHDGCVLKMLYLPGEALPDLINRLEAMTSCVPADDEYLRAMDAEHIYVMDAEHFRVADAIIDWLDNYYHIVDYKQTCIIRGDVNGRNFLWDGVRCWGVDFEERVTGEREEDIGRFIAFVETYDPPGTAIKIAFMERFINKAVQTFDADPVRITYYRELELEDMKIRRVKVLSNPLNPVKLADPHSP